MEIPKVTHAGKLILGDVNIPCAVLDNGVRVITEFGITTALKSRSGASKRLKKATDEGRAQMPIFLAAKNLIPFISDELRYGPLIPIVYLDKRGKERSGYNATALPMICDVWLEARQARALTSQQQSRALQAEILTRSLSKIGIIALIDEATGYQQDRERDALAQLLSKYLTEERLRWAKIFPDEFYKQIYRLNKWMWPPHSTARTPLIGKMTNEIVYERLPVGVLDKLRELNPINPTTKRRRWKYTQFLSEDIGQPDLKAHLLQVIALMRAAYSWPSFIRLLDKSLPKGGPYQLTFDVDE